MAAGRNRARIAAAARPLPTLLSPIPGKLFGEKGEIWIFARETFDAPGNRSRRHNRLCCVRTRRRFDRLRFRPERSPGNERRMEMARELRTLRISVAQQPVLRAAVIPRDSCRRAWVTALTGPCSVYDQLNRSEYGRYSYLATIPSDPRSRFLVAPVFPSRL